MTFNLRKLQLDDYDKGFFECLAYLTKSPKIPFEQFSLILQNYPGVTYVIEDESKNLIVASGSLVIEENLFEKISHIENIVTHIDYRGQGHAKNIINALLKEAGDLKVDLYCDEKNQIIYQKMGFEVTSETFQLYL